MSSSIRFVLSAVLFSLAGLASAASFKVVSAEPAPELNRLYDRTNGWVGADANYSVPFSSNRTLLFFGDTWIGNIVNSLRTNVVMINNSAGVLHHDATRRIDFFWRTNAGGKATGIFLPEDGRGFMWPFGGVCVSNTLHIVLFQMETTKAGGAFGFRNVAVWLASVTNAQDSPVQWSITQQRLPFTELDDARKIFFGAAMLRHGEHVYVYGTEEQFKEKNFGRRMVLARADVAVVSDFSRWEFFAEGAWRKDFKKVMPLATAVPTESSVTFMPALNRFVFVGNGDFLSPRILARTAPDPWGPWSEPVTLYECPDVKLSKEVFCYAGKAHPSLSSNDELVISYAANSFSFAEVVNDARLYWPRFVRVKVGW